MNLTFKRLAYLSVLLNLILISWFFLKRAYFAAPHPTAGLSYADILNYGRSATLNPLPMDSTDIVFIGDSQTEKFPVSEMFTHVKNRGIGQNTSAHIIGRIDPIIKAHPKKIFLQMGLNDFAFGVSVDSLLKNYGIILGKIREGSPKTEIYVTSIMPVASYSSDFRYEPDIIAANKQLRTLPGIHFIDLFPLMLSGESLDSTLTWDGGHLNYKGYMIWKKAVDSLVN